MLRRVIRIGASLAIFVLVLRVVGVREVIQSFADIRPLLVAGALGMVLIDSLFRSANWAQLLNPFAPFSFGQTWLAYLAGSFYGSLIPSTVGTDAARAVTIARRISVDIRVSAGSLVTLNLLGLGAVGALGMTAAIILSLQKPTDFLTVNLCFSGLLALTAGVLLFTALGCRLVELLFKATQVWPAAQRFLEPLLSTLLVLPKSRRSQLSLAGIAMLSQIIRVSVAALVASSLGLIIDWWVLAAIAPLVAIVSMIPLSFLGIGIGQGAMVYFLAHFDIAGSDAFVLSATIATVYIGLALAGGVTVTLDSAFRSKVRSREINN